jgi:transposase
VAESARERALADAGLLHPAPGAVRAELFVTQPQFFAAFDKLQVKYEMLRAHVVDGTAASTAASTHGYSRASFYLVARAFEAAGMVGLLDERPGRRGPLKVSAEVLAFLAERAQVRPGISGAQLAVELEAELGLRLHRRTIERSLGERGGRR